MDDSIKNYEERKAEKERRREEARLSQLRSGRGRKLRRVVIWLVVIFVAGYGIYALVKSQNPESPDFSRQFPSLGAQHIAIGSEHPPYNSNPPSSGWHYPSPAPSGFYETVLPDEQVVHNLEHGEIWIAYHPRITDAVKDNLRSFADDAFVIVSPRDKNETDLALVAWGRVDAFEVGEELDADEEQRVRDFILRYKDRGPERLPPGSHRR